MKIEFTIFNDPPRHITFDSEQLPPGHELNRFLVNKDDHGRIYIVAVVKDSEGMIFPLQVLK